MRFLYWGKDGGPRSTVHGFWIIEIKWLFSLVLLRFDEGSREVYHSHAFNAVTWWLRGGVDEYFPDGKGRPWVPSWRPKFTPRNCCHKVYARKRTWALSLRGPWSRTWVEYDPATVTTTTLTHGRRVV